MTSGVGIGQFPGVGGNGSGKGGNGGSLRRSLNCFVCLGLFGLEDGAKGPDKLDLLLRVLIMHVDF